MTRQVRIAIAAVAAAGFALFAPLGAGPAFAAPNYQGMWWNAPAESESGWGINFAHQGDTIFATWFTYGPDGKSLWLVVAATRTATGTYAGDVYTGTGPPFNVVPFDRGKVVPAKIGSATFTFADDSNATFAYTVDGVARTKSITRQVFGDPLPACGAGGSTSPAAAKNYQDMWWGAPAESESGWGINFAHQGETIFATWFTYGADGKPLWLVTAANRTGTDVYAGTLYTGTGPAFSAATFDPAQVAAMPVGTATFTFADGNNATFAYTAWGATQTKAITRQVFNGASTVCTSPLSAADRRKDAARFLRQATFGAPSEAIDALVAQGYDAWIAEQFAKPAVSHVTTALADPNLRVTGKTGVVGMASIWKQFFEGDDQLRQRVGYALSQIFVVSLNNSGVESAHCGLSAYVDILNRGAFGNFRDLLKDVTLSPVMGEYLSMKGSAKADPVAQTQPDENYAREVMQLFTVGLVMLNEDGTVRLGPDGLPQPTFNEDTVKGFARALSGWTHGGQDQANGGRWLYPGLIVPGPDPDVATEATIARACPAWTRPMEPWMTQYLVTTDPPPRFVEGPAHETGAKQLMVYPGARYSTLPAGQSPQTDLENVIDNLFHHPNVGPFIAKQLIQRLVTSNPSPGYVARVARKFNDNGSGVRGDMKAVVRAILLDDEARSLWVARQPRFGKLTEPVVRFVAFHRAFHGRRGSGYYDLFDLSSPDYLGQNPLKAPSVFNFYHPDYSPAGPLTDARLLGPEFEITNASTISGFAEFANANFIRGFENYLPDPGRRIMPDYTEYLPLADDPARLIDALELVLCAGCLDPAFKAQLVDAIGKVNWGDPSAPDRAAYLRQEKLHAALWQIINLADYSVQK